MSLGAGALGLALAGCAASAAPAWRLVEPWVAEAPSSATPVPTPTSTPDPILRLLPPTRLPGQAYATPTPDAVRTQPAPRLETETYVVRWGDTLAQIGARFDVGANLIAAANHLANPDVLSVGSVLAIPPPVPQPPGPAFKVIPDSELVDGPASGLFDVSAEVSRWNGALARYRETVEGRPLGGAAIVELVARRYSVNPRLLLALLEYQSGALTGEPRQGNWTYPLGYAARGWEGLFSQLSWAANTLNAGYYRWRSGWAGPFVLADGTSAPPGPGINAGTAGVANLFAALLSGDDWRRALDEGGFYQTYLSLFGIPFDRAVEPLVPPDLTQPTLRLPIEDGATWSFTGGPHSAWDTGAAWAALDFAPPGDAYGCVVSQAWVVAAADGLVIRADQGEVILDLDEDGYEQTGWVLLYMHVDSRDRVQSGVRLRAGDRIGHPSCEGGVSNGTHVHLARKYNGEWIPADGSLPFDLDGWVSAGTGAEYDGTLTRGSASLEACACREAGNQISR